MASEAQAKSRAFELRIDRDTLAMAYRENAIRELAEVSSREAELAERRRAITEQIRRLEVRAPVSGIVLGLQVTAPRSVLRAADPILFIVPQDRPLIVIAEIASMDVDQVYVGQKVRLRFSAFNSRTTPEIEGKIAVIAADAVRDERTLKSHYRVEIDIVPKEIDKLGEVTLVPGMPVEAFISTVDRTPFSYLLGPFADYFNRALRES
jgi:HlyD family secretion protein